MGLFRRSQRFSGNPDSLVAGGQRVTREDADQIRRLAQPWQTRAFSYYDQLGEVWYASQFYARMLSPLRLYAAELDENGDWVETTFEPAVAALERVQDPDGGRELLLSSYGRLMFLVGEATLLCSLDRDTGLEQWEMLSTDELRIQGGVYMRYRAPSWLAESLREPSDDDFVPIDDKTAVAYRIWRRHPRFSGLADAPMKGVLDLAEELLILTRTVRARARSRLAGPGILAISDSFSYKPLEPVPDEDVNEDPFLRDLTEAMVAPITDEGTASAVVPLLIRGPQEAIKDGIRHVQIADPTQLYPETGLRRECIERMAIGLDMPAEVLTGIGDINHWGAWQVDEQTWKSHGQPVANQFVSDLNTAFFRPQLRADGVTDWRRYAIAYDPSAVINHPDRTKDAKDLYDKRAIGKRALRDAGGFDEEDAPTEEERAEMIGVATRDSSLAWYGIPSVRSGAIEPVAGEVVSPAGEGGAADGPSTGAEVEPGPPATDDTPLQPSVVGSAVRAVARVVGSADLAVLRAREAAGNRLRSLAKKDPDLLALLADVKARDVAAFLGRDRVRALGVSNEAELVASAAALVVDAIRLGGVRDPDVAALIGAKIEQHVLRTLYEERPAPMPPQFQTYVASLLQKP